MEYEECIEPLRSGRFFEDYEEGAVYAAVSTQRVPPPCE